MSNIKKIINTTTSFMICTIYLSLLFLSQPLANTDNSTIFYDITHLNLTHVQKVVEPKDINTIQTIVKDASKRGTKISVCGTRFSQGGHICYPNGIVIDMRGLNNVIHLDTQNKEITVQAGITWKEIQKEIDKFDLAIKTMQSYNDFSVGGSLSVNVHGQDMEKPMLIETIKEIHLLTSDGNIKICNHEENYDLFCAAIGGYGLVGIITQVTLMLTDNTTLKKKTKQLKTSQYLEYFFNEIKNNPTIELHSARLSMNPFSFLDEVLAISYEKTEQRTNIEKIKDYTSALRDRIIFYLLKKSYTARILRNPLERFIFESEEVVSRNNAMASSVEGICDYNTGDVNILQEYFIPIDAFDSFIQSLKDIISTHRANLLNISIRYVKQNRESFLTYAPNDSFAFVLFINHKRDTNAITKIKKMTQDLIKAALHVNGTSYLPYQLYASYDQLRKSYPRFDDLISIKKQTDPQEIFSNNFFQQYK